MSDPALSVSVDLSHGTRPDLATDPGSDAGFTLIELMVVLLILAILLAIAIPTFLGVTGGANDRSAQSNLNTALTSLKTAATQSNQSYTGITAASMLTNEPSLKWSQSIVGTPATVSAQGPVSFYISADGNGVAVVSFSKNKRPPAGGPWTTCRLSSTPLAHTVPPVRWLAVTPPTCRQGAGTCTTARAWLRVHLLPATRPSRRSVPTGVPPSRRPRSNSSACSAEPLSSGQ